MIFSIAQLGLLLFAMLGGFSPPTLAESVPSWAADYLDATGQVQRRLLKAAQTPEGLTPLDQRADAAVQTQLQALRQTANAHGEVAVTVGLRVPFAPEGFLTAARATAQRDDIKHQQQAVLAALGTLPFKTSATVFETVPFMALTVDAAGLDALAKHPAVIQIAPVRWYGLHLQQSSPLIGASRAWAATPSYTGAGQAVAILDTGVNKNHPFLAGKVVAEACYSTNASGVNSLCPEGVTQSTAPGSGLNCDANLSDGCNHGTHVAGIAAGRDATFAGVGRDASVIAIQVFSYVSSQGDLGASDANINSGLEQVYALRNTFAIAAANLSLGGGQYTGTCDSANLATKSIVDNLRAAGIATVVASGNESFTNKLAWPACISSAISVGATSDTTDQVMSFSNSASFLNLLAPGSLIYSAVVSGFDNYQGTSMAAPQVAGAWTLLKQQNPQLGVTESLERLTATGVPIRDSRNSITKPRIQIDAALGLTGGGNPGFIIATTAVPTAGGTVRCTPNPVANGESSTCTATANGNFAFSGWSGDCTGTAACVLTNVTGPRAVTATFAPPPSTCVLNTVGNGTVNGAWDSGCVSVNRLGSYAQFYSFTLANPATVTVDLVSSTDPYLYLLAGSDLSGAVIETDDDDGDGLNARIVRSLDAGTYTLEATTFSGNRTGNFTVTVAGLGTSDRFPITATAVPSSGGTVRCTPNPVTNGESSTCTASPGTGFTFSGWSGDCIGTAACVLTNVTGPRTVTATFAPPPSTCVLTAVGNGTVNGAWDSGCVSVNRLGSYAQFYSFTLANPATVTVDLVSSTDPYLYLLAGSDLSGAVIEADDDDGDGLNARIVRALAAGAYTLEATTFSSGRTGNFTVTVAGANSVPSYAIATTAIPSGGGTVRCTPNPVANGESSTCTASPAMGFTFSGWSGDCTGTMACMLTTVTGPRTVTATFAATTATRPAMIGIATRGFAGAGDEALIGGLVMQGTGQKRILFTAKGPSLAAQGITGPLANPQISVPQIPTPNVNDDWETDAGASELRNLNRAPSNPAEAALLRTLGAGAYTPVVTGVGGTTGVVLMEIYDLSPEVTTLRFKGLATRGPVRLGEQQMIGGVILQGRGINTMLFTAKGPSMADQGVSGLLADPQLLLPQISNLSNDNWNNSANAQRIIDLGRAPSRLAEAAILIDVAAGAFTPIISGVNSTTGTGLVEMYEIP